MSCRLGLKSTIVSSLLVFFFLQFSEQNSELLRKFALVGAPRGGPRGLRQTCCDFPCAVIGYPRGEDQGGPGCTGSDAVLGAFRKEEACGGQGLHGHHPSPTICITRSEMTLSLYCFEQRVQGRRRAPCVHVFRSDVIKVDEGCSWPNSIEFRCNAKPNHENITHETVNSAASAIVTELPSSTAHCAEGI